MGMERSMPIWITEDVSLLVPDLPQEILSPLDFILVLDALERESVHHAQDATPLTQLGKDHFGRIGSEAVACRHE